MTQLTAPNGTRLVDGEEVPVAGTYRIDRSHSMVEFVGRHLMVTKVRGRFTDFEGEIRVGDALEDSSVDVTVQAASIDTGDVNRNGHLAGADFLDIENHPTLEFHSTRIEPGRRGWTLAGDLTVRGVTREVAFDLTFDGAIPDPWGNTRVAFTAVAEVDREDWGLTWNKVLETGGVLVGRKANIEITIQAVPEQPAETTPNSAANGR